MASCCRQVLETRYDRNVGSHLIRIPTDKINKSKGKQIAWLSLDRSLQSTKACQTFFKNILNQVRDTPPYTNQHKEVTSQREFKRA